MKEYKLKINDTSYTVEIKEVTDESVTAIVNGEEYQVAVEKIQNIAPEQTIAMPQASLPVKSAPAVSRQPAGKTAEGTILTPIPGQIINISVSCGDKVLTGQKLLILEAMKLENVITATCDGVVQEIMVAEGDVVNQGQPLVTVA